MHICAVVKKVQIVIVSERYVHIVWPLLLEVGMLREEILCGIQIFVTVLPIEVGHRSTTAALLGNIALKKRAVLEWDAKTEQFVNNKEANALLKVEYRSPYKFPGT